jgi:hypothetical protein
MATPTTSTTTTTTEEKDRSTANGSAAPRYTATGIDRDRAI